MTHSNSINSPWPDAHISMCVNLCPDDNSPKLSVKKSRQLDLHELLGSTSNEDTKEQWNVPGRNGSPQIPWDWFGWWGREGLIPAAPQHDMHYAMKSSVAPLGGNRGDFSPVFPPYASKNHQYWRCRSFICIELFNNCFFTGLKSMIQFFHLSWN